MQLSDHFSFEELTKTSNTDLQDINIKTAQNNKQILTNLRALCTDVLEPLRKIIGKPLNINSGFRYQDLNEAMGSTATSQHCFGEAADISVNDMSHDDIFKIIQNNIDKFNGSVAQCILEKGSRSDWIHISLLTPRYKPTLITRYGPNCNTVFLHTPDAGGTYIPVKII